jgi:hypothetical protein
MSRQKSDPEIEIELRSVAAGFEARVLASPVGRASAAFTMPFSGGELQSLLTSCERQIRGRAKTRRDLEAERAPYGVSPQPTPVPSIFDPKVVGHKLFEALFLPPIDQCFRAAIAGLNLRNGVARRGTTPLRIRLTFDRQEDYAKLAALPWELLRDDRQFLALHAHTPLVRSHNLRTVPCGAVAGPLRILLVESNPADHVSLDTARERETIRATLANNSRCEVVCLDHQDISSLREHVRETNCHILHFMGHGGLQNSSQERFVLWFDGKNGHAEPVTGELLAEFIKDSPSLRLVVLNSCWSATLPRRAGQDPFTGVATALMARDIPAVVAMQFPISDPAAIAFSAAFYKRLAEGGGISAAVTEGRLAILREDPDTLEWVTPVLFLAGEDRLFDVARARRRKSPPTGTGSAGSEHPSTNAANSQPPRVLVVKTFEGYISEQRPDDLLDLTPYFEKRRIRQPSLWQDEVFPRLQDFLWRHASAHLPLILDLAAHATLAFAAGYCLEAKSGLDITLMQRGQKGTSAWRAAAGPSRQGPMWTEGEPDLWRDVAATEVAMAVSITWQILPDVIAYLDKSLIPIGRVIPMTLYPSPSSTGVVDGLHALQLAQDLALKIRSRSAQERSATLHLFLSGPNALPFYLGQLGKSLGVIQLYEHDPANNVSGAYEASLRLPTIVDMHPWR